jgi:hypothetical protein
MMEEMVYRLDVEWHERRAESDNGAAVVAFEELKDRWLKDAARARALKMPEPDKPVPAFKRTVTATPFVIGQPYEITTKIGPERVADGTMTLEAIKGWLVTDFPPNVTAISHRTSDGGFWVCFPNDTRPTGWKEVRDGRNLEKYEGFWPFGRKSFYFDRGAA